MRNYKVIGLENFTSKTNKQITKIHAIYEDIRIFGVGCETFFIMTENVPDELCVDTKFNVYYGAQGSKGFLAGVNIIA